MVAASLATTATVGWDNGAVMMMKEELSVVIKRYEFACCLFPWRKKEKRRKKNSAIAFKSRCSSSLSLDVEWVLFISRLIAVEDKRR
jgi:hypothetical protein